MGTDAPRILLVNPWIHDFAAYDVWARPLGLLNIAGLLRAAGFVVSYVDCLDRFHPRADRAASVDPTARCGRGPYRKTPIQRPAGLDDVPRTYSRYGVDPEWLAADLQSLDRPDLILVTSMMTYWHPGVRETIVHLRSAFPKSPIVLGGIYARLWTDHAKVAAGADEVLTLSHEREILDWVAGRTGFLPSLRVDVADLDALPYPALDLQSMIPFVPLLTVRGCPFHCAYCASKFLEPTCRRQRPNAVAEEIDFWRKDFGVRDFVFYDDALLVDPEHHAIPLLEAIIRAGGRDAIRFHTPNAVHIRGVTQETADLMFRAGFHTLRLGLETTAFENRYDLDQKVTEAEFRQATARLKEAGFSQDQVGAYLLVGLPGQDMAAVETSIRVVKESGVTPIPAHYTPIPHTALWEKAVATSRYDLRSDPIFTNNAVFPCMEAFSWETASWLKLLCME